MRTIEDLIQEVQSELDVKEAKMKSDGLNVTFADVYEFAQMNLIIGFLRKRNLNTGANESGESKIPTPDWA